MAKKSVLEIEIRDEAFKSFVALFEKYQSQLDKMPGQWAKVGKENIKASKGFDKNVDSLGKFNSTQKKVTSEQEKFNKQTVNSNRNLTNMAKTTGGIAKSIAGATASLMKWGALSVGVGLLGAGGGLFGLSSLASGASNTRRETKGLGVSAGALKSAEVNFTKFFGEGGTAQILDRINEAKADPTKAGAFRMLGIGQAQVDQQTPTELLNEIIPKLAERYRTLPKGAEGATYDAMGLGTFADSKTAKQLASYTDKEIQDTIKKQAQDQKQYELTDKQLANWQKLNIALDGAGQKIRTTFLDQLEPLSANLSNLSDKFSDAVNSFLRNPRMGEWIDSFSNSLGKAAEYLGGDKVKHDIDRFLVALERLGDGIYKIVNFIAPDNSYDAAKDKENWEKMSFFEKVESSIARGVEKVSDVILPEYVGKKARADRLNKESEYLDSKYGSSEDLKSRWKNFNFGNIRSLKGEDSYNGFYAPKSEQEGFLKMANQLKLYNNGQSKAAGNRKLENIEDIISTYAPPSENDTKSYIQNVANMTGFNPKEKLNLNDNKTLARLMSAMIRQEGKGNHSPEKIGRIVVSNTAGSDLVVNAAQVAQ
jgi:hypothetical protein